MAFMQAIRRASALALLAALACLPAHADERDREADAIRRVDAQWSADLAAHNLDAVMRNYADDAAFLVPNEPIMQGKPAIRRWFQARMDRPGYSATFRPTKIVVASSLDTAYELGAFEAQVRDDQGQLVRSRGKHLVVWEKRDGAWRVVAESISSDGAP